MAVEIFLPKMSDHMEKGRIIRWLVQEGQSVQRGQVLLELETDKAVGEIEAPEDGVLKGVRAGDGAEVAVGETIAFIARPEENVPSMPRLESPLPEAQASLSVPETPLGLSESGIVPATPVARRVAKELGVDLRLVKGTGPGGRVKEEDVRAFAAQVSTAPPLPKAAVPLSPAAPSPAVPASPALAAQDDSSELTLNSIQRLTAQRMLESVQNAPHFYLDVEVDMSQALEVLETQSERIQAETGERPSVTALLVRVVAGALRRHPRLNARYEAGHLKLFPQINIGVAVGTPDGLVVPVIRDADQKNLAQITSQLRAFQAKSKTLHFSPEDLDGGTFTLTNLGMHGIDHFIAIINPPQSAILAAGRIVKKPVGLPDNTIALRPMMTLTLSADHRAMDGLQAAAFLTDVRRDLEQPYNLL